MVLRTDTTESDVMKDNQTNPVPGNGARPVENLETMSDITQRLQFLELNDADVERLRGCKDTLQKYSSQFVETFYRHLLAFEDTAQFLRDPLIVDRLKELQQAHLASILDANWDEAYVARRTQVGRAHADRNVQPQHYLGAYNQYVQHCLEYLAIGDSVEVQDTKRRFASLVKAIFLDIGLTLDAYFVQTTIDLRHALDMFWKANNELKQFAHFTSHDLKTPLGTVANLCEEVLDEFGTGIPKEARELIAAAQRTVYRMSSTIDELLSTTITTGGSDSDDEVSSDEPFQESVERVRPLLDQRGIELIVPNVFPRIVGNDIEIREVFYNLLSNAAKYIDNDNGQVVVRVKPDGSHCIFSVTDNGPGIPYEEQARIFAPFRRLAQHDKCAGSGLGLYFTKQLVEKQGGRIWVESEPGVGSSFLIRWKQAASAKR